MVNTKQFYYYYYYNYKMHVALLHPVLI